MKFSDKAKEYYRKALKIAMVPIISGMLATSAAYSKDLPISEGTGKAGEASIGYELVEKAEEIIEKSDIGSVPDQIQKLKEDVKQNNGEGASLVREFKDYSKTLKDTEKNLQDYLHKIEKEKSLDKEQKEKMKGVYEKLLKHVKGQVKSIEETGGLLSQFYGNGEEESKEK